MGKIIENRDKNIKKVIKSVSKGNITKASKLISKIDNLQSLVELGLMYQNKGNNAIVVKVLEKIDRINPTDDKGWSNKGAAFAFLGSYDKSIKYFDKAIHLNPSFAGAWANNGRAFEHLGRYDESVKCFDKAIEIG